MESEQLFLKSLIKLINIVNDIFRFEIGYT